MPQLIKNRHRIFLAHLNGRFGPADEGQFVEIGRESNAAGQPEIGTTRPTVKAWTRKMEPAAFHGVAGDFCKIVEPHTEADVVAILLQLLIAIGSVFGRNAYFQVERSRHQVNFFGITVGASSKSRKGTSLDQAIALVAPSDPAWAKERIKSGLSSGEGLIESVRDEREGISKPGKPPTIIPGVEDKRLLVVESELASLFAVLGREGNTLSALLRQAWDGRPLQTMTKNSPGCATDAHISIIGHITDDELRRMLDRTEMANGFANRFLFAYVVRSKCLPNGGSLNLQELAPLSKRLAAAVQKARSFGLMKRSPAANDLWVKVYPELSEGAPGLVGAMTSRAEAQVLRLSCLYALLDATDTIEAPHLEAALAVWAYCEDSVRFVFGDSLGDPEADEILSRLRQSPQGLTRTELSDGFSRHRNASQLQRALSLLHQRGRISQRIEQTAGRPIERWVYVLAAK